MTAGHCTYGLGEINLPCSLTVTGYQALTKAAPPHYVSFRRLLLPHPLSVTTGA